jgi:Fe-S-cluster containining protein
VDDSPPKSETPPKTGLLSEVTVRGEGYREDAEDNPYWLAEEAEPHPCPEKGCIRRNLCCRSNPGWFGPGEAERSAELLGMTPDAFVRTYLVIDHVEVEGTKVEVFAPAKLGRDGNPLIAPATRTDRLYQLLRGPCIFFDGQGCRIYGARPVECRVYVCTNPPEANLTHQQIGRMWLEAGAGDDTE